MSRRPPARAHRRSPSSPRTRGPAAGLAIAALASVAAPSIAAADPAATHARAPMYLGVGALGSLVFGRDRAKALGGELSYVYWPNPFVSTLHFGAFAHAQAYFADDGTHPRVAIGPQIGFAIDGFGIGLELGGAIRGRTDAHATTLGLHLAPYVSMLGIASISPRVTILPTAIGAAGLPAHAAEYAVTLAIQYPFRLEGNVLCSAQRPLCDPSYYGAPVDPLGAPSPP